MNTKERKAWRQGRSVDIECTADIWVDEYLEYATTEALLEELSGRDFDPTEEMSLKDVDLVALFIQKHNLSITEAEIVKNFLTQWK